MHVAIIPKRSGRLSHRFLYDLLLILLCALCLSGCVSSKPPQINPEEYGLSLFQSSQGDWECYLPSEPKSVDEEAISVTRVFDALSIDNKDINLEQWRSYSDEGYVAIIRMSGSGIEQLKAQTTTEEDMVWVLLDNLGAWAFIGDTGWVPAIPNGFKDKGGEFPAFNRIEYDNKNTSAYSMDASFVFRNYALEAYKEGSWGVACTYSDNAYYLLAIMCDSTPATRAMLKSFEVFPDVEYAPIEKPKYPEGSISWEEASSHIGETVTVYGRIVGSEYASTSTGKPTFLDVGAAYPDSSRVSLIIWGKNRSAFSGSPEKTYKGKTVCVTGVPYIHDGVCNIEVSSPSQIRVI